MFFFRKSSATARRYNRSLSRGSENPEKPGENENVHEIEMDSDKSSKGSLPLFWNRPLRSRIQTRDYNTELDRRIAKQTQNLKSAFKKASNNNYALQPKNLPPMATTHIHVTNKFAPLEEIPNRPYGIRLDELQRQASVKYEKAVRTLGLKRATENRSYRYQLEAAKKSKRSDIYDIVAEIKHREQTKVALAPQLQPKNIKPYGDIIPVSWTSPVLERLRLKPLSISRLIKKAVNDPNNQVRSFSTMGPSRASSKMAHNFGNCSKNMSDHNKIEVENKEIGGKQNDIQFQKVDDKQDETKCNNKFDSASHKKDLASEYASSRSGPQPKLQIPGEFIDGKVMLFYAKRGGKGNMICSKILPKHEQMTNATDVSKSQLTASAENNADFNNFSKPVITKAGPKVTLQSRELEDTAGDVESINPGTYEKFTVPWMSWGEKVKMKMEEKIQQRLQNPSFEDRPVSTHNSKSVPMLHPYNAKEEVFSNRANIQVRDFSTFSKSERTGLRHSSSDLEELEDLNFSLPHQQDLMEGVDWPDMGPISKSGSKLLHTSTRLYTTKCSRGVLEPEGTVMVKLRRLPKIKLPEPPKLCPTNPCAVNCRADDNLHVEQKKLPALKLRPCTKTCTEPCMIEGEPLVRPKRRSNPELATIVRICTKPGCGPRADDGLQVQPKKLPKLIPKPCGRCEEITMTSPPLVRLIPRPVPDPPQCVIPGPCGKDAPCRADAGMQVVRKKLPTLVPLNCPRLCPPEMIGGPPLVRPKANPIPIQIRPCSEEQIDPCPPRADNISGYKVERRRLPTVLLAEKHNEMTIKEYAIAQLEKQKRSYSSYSKCDMCCFSNRKLQPDLKTIQQEICPTQWAEFKGFLKAGDDGKLEVYDTATETVDTSTGTELLVTRKPIGGLKKREDDIPQRLLKSGYSVSFGEKRNYSVSAPAFLAHRDFDEPPLPDPEKFIFPKLKRLEKRRGFDNDFPPDSVPWTVKDEDCMRQYIEENPEPPPRMDNVLQYEVKSKQLPVIPAGICRKLPAAPPMDQIVLMPPRKRYEPVQEREPCKPISVRCDRADANLTESPRKLPPPPISECKPVKPMEYKQLRKLPRLKFEDVDPPRYCGLPPPNPCRDNTRADQGIDFAPRKSLPILKPTNCPRSKGIKYQALRPLKRLPPHPFMERLPCPPKRNQCKEPRADDYYEVVPKVLPPVLKKDGKLLQVDPPLPCPLQAKRKRYSTFCASEWGMFDSSISRRYLSTTSMLQSSPKDCKIKKDEEKKKKCYKTNISPCKPIPAGKSVVCPLDPIHKPCTKQKSPYPAFSECKDDDPYLGITECEKNTKHLQPKYPMVGEFLILQPPPPVQGHIDTGLEEECILKKINLKRDIGTKTCNDFDKPTPVFRARDLMKSALKQVGGTLTDDVRCEIVPSDRPPMTCEKNEGKQGTKKGEPGELICQGGRKVHPKQLKTAPCQPYDPKPSPPKKTICEKKEVECPDPCEPDPKKKSDGIKSAVPLGKKGGGKGGKGGTGGLGGGQIRSVGSGSNTGSGASAASSGGQKPNCKATKACKKAGAEKKVEAKKGSSDPCAQLKDKKAPKEENASTDPCGQFKDKKASNDPCAQFKGESKQQAKDESVCSEKEASSNVCGAEKSEKKAESGKKCPKVKSECSSGQTKAKPSAEAKKKSAKKCADLLQEDKPKSEKPDKSIAIKCAQKKKGKPKQKSPLAIKCRPAKKPPPPKPKMKCLPKAPPVVAPRKSLWDRILDFFRARPGCPPPDQWKKDKLKREAERAAAAAGYELCEKKKPKKPCTFPPPQKQKSVGDAKKSKCGMKVNSCGKGAQKGGAGVTCKPKVNANQKSKCAKKPKPCPPRKPTPKGGNTRCMSSHRRSKSGCARVKMSACQLPTTDSYIPKGVDPCQKYPSSVELPYANFPESGENFKLPISEYVEKTSMFAKIKPEIELSPKQTRPYCTCKQDTLLNHIRSTTVAFGQRLSFSTTPNQFGLCGPFSCKHLSTDRINANIMDNIDSKRTTLRSQTDDNLNQKMGFSNILALPVMSSALYSCPVAKVYNASILSNCVSGLSTNSITQYIEKAGLFQRRDPELNITPQQIRHYSSPKDCKLGPPEGPKKCKQFQQQPCCLEKGRKDCDEKDPYPPCTPIEAPYPSFSECYARFKRLPVLECTEQNKRLTRLKNDNAYSVSKIQEMAKKKNSRRYSTITNKRNFSSCPKNGNSYPMLLPELSEETLRDMEEKELAKKVLNTVKSGMEAIAISSSDVEAQEAYYQLYEELEKLCENDLNKSMSVCEDLELQPICSRDIFSDSALSGNNMPLFADDSLQQLMTIDAIKSFCFSIPTMSTTLYEESEQYKTEKLQKQLDELLDYYKAQKI